MRDNKSRFTKGAEEGTKITVNVPKLASIIYCMLLLLIFMPWISLVCRLEILKKLLSFFDNLLMMKVEEEKDTPKKNGLFS